jgi:excisionase family DNA binding protein
MRQKNPKIEPCYFDLAGASLYTGGGLSVRTLRRLISEPGGLPFYQAGRGKILIKRADLETWLAARRREPQDLDRLADETIAELRGER